MLIELLEKDLNDPEHERDVGELLRAKKSRIRHCERRRREIEIQVRLYTENGAKVTVMNKPPIYN